MAEKNHIYGEDGHHIKTLIGAVLGYAADGLDMFLLSFVLVFIIKDFGLTTAEAGNLTLATTIGMWIGSYIFGYLADRYGRTRTLSLSIILFAVATFLMYFATDYYILLILRFAIGIGVGGEFGIGMAIVTETWAPKMRARATSWVALGWQGGVLLAAIIPALIVPQFGWRAVFLIGLIPALIAIYVRMHLREPILWQKKRNRQDQLIAKRKNGTLTLDEEKELYQLAGMPLKKLFINKKITTTTIGLTVMCLVQNFGYYAIFSWMPTILSQKYGYSLAKTSGWMIISIAGMILGIILFGILADKIGRKKTFTLWYVCGTIYCVIYFFFFTSQEALLWGSFLLGLTVNGMMGGYGAVIAENYPSEARSTAENLIFGTGRGLSGFGPAIIGYLATGGNLIGAMSLVFIIYPIALIFMLLTVPETKGIKID